jgi:hypothetical protein
MALLVRSRAGKTKPSHGDVVRISDSGRYSAIARIIGNPEVDSGGPEVLFEEICRDTIHSAEVRPADFESEVSAMCCLGCK